MNLQHMKYAVEVEKTGSISQAADNLFMGQPNLSKAIRELERSIGIQIFTRTQKGVATTEKGREFLHGAKRILDSIEAMETRYRPGNADRQYLSVSAPRGAYIDDAFTALLRELDTEKELDIDFRASGSLGAVRRVNEDGHHLGVVRYRVECAQAFSRLLSGYKLCARPIYEYEGRVLMSEEHPAARGETVRLSDLEGCTEILDGVCALSGRDTPCAAGALRRRGRLLVSGQGDPLDLPSRLPGAYMWSPPIPEESLRRHHLIQKRCAGSASRCVDALIFPVGYQFSRLESLFLEKLEEEKRKYIKISAKK